MSTRLSDCWEANEEGGEKQVEHGEHVLDSSMVVWTGLREETSFCRKIPEVLCYSAGIS